MYDCDKCGGDLTAMGGPDCTCGREMIFYRYNDSKHRLDKFPTLEKFKLLRETPKGHWIVLPWDRTGDLYKKWVSKTARKRFAYPTEEEALNSYIARKRRQVIILEQQLKNAGEGLLAATRGKNSCRRKLEIYKSGSPHVAKESKGFLISTRA